MSEEIVKKEDFTPFLLFDRLDDKLIRDELEGKMAGVLTYHYKQGGQEVWGISKAGVDEAKSELAKKGEVVRELEVTFQDGKDEAYFNVKAGRYVVSREGQEILLDTAFGFKRQPKKYESGKDNPFWYEQGAIKASRNASMRLIPKSIQQGVIEYAKKQGKVKDVTPTGEEKKSSPSPQEPPQTQDSSSPEKTYRIKTIGAAKVSAKTKRTYYEVITTDDEKFWIGEEDKQLLDNAKYAAQENAEVMLLVAKNKRIEKIEPVINAIAELEPGSNDE